MSIDLCIHKIEIKRMSVQRQQSDIPNGYKLSSSQSDTAGALPEAVAVRLVEDEVHEMPFITVS